MTQNQREYTRFLYWFTFFQELHPIPLNSSKCSTKHTSLQTNTSPRLNLEPHKIDQDSFAEPYHTVCKTLPHSMQNPTTNIK